MRTPLIVSDFLDRAAALYRHSAGVVCGATRLSYGEFAERVHCLSSALAQRGVRPRDVVACLSFNCHRLLELYFAVPQMGAILLPINIRLSADEIAYVLNDSGATTILADRALAGLLDAVRAQVPACNRVIHMGGVAAAERAPGVEDYEALLASGSSNFQRPPVDEEDVAELFYTSGTTARPKGVMLTHRNIVAHAYGVAPAFGLTDADVQLHSIPLFHVNGWGTPHTLTAAGGRHVMLARFDPEQVLETIERERVTVILLVPTMAVALLNAPSFATRDLRSLRMVMFGGAATPPSLIEALDRRLPGCRVTCGYGLSEATPVLTVARLKPGLEADYAQSVAYRASAGLPIGGVRVEVLDDRGTVLPHDGETVGEVCAQGNSIMKGYWRQPEETAKALAGGWLHTGDMGTIDAEGYLHIVDRKKDIIITGGENVASIEIEKALYAHPAVLECAAVGAPDERWGEIPVAFVVLKSGMQADESELALFCRTKLAGYKVPKRIKFVEALPKGGTGKILKRDLRALYARETAQAP